MLARARGINVVATAESGKEAVELIRRLRPHVVLMDVGIAGMGGLEALRRLAKDETNSRVSILSTYDDEEHLQEAMAAGATDYIRKSATATQICDAIRRVAAGGKAVGLSARTLHRLTAGRSAPTPEQLTVREREVARYLVEGMTNQEISQELHISRETVKSHVARIMAKLDASDRTLAAVRAMQLGIIDTPSGQRQGWRLSVPDSGHRRSHEAGA
ncbi:MAG: response regulator transcription factor [Chloroflexi bacterium]|nr:response regulator transcription factor [Chloroflexota bacterium]